MVEMLKAEAFKTEASEEFAQIARIVAGKVAELLCAPVLVVDDRGMIITESQPTDAHFDLAEFDIPGRGLENSLRIPLVHQQEIGEVIVGTALIQKQISHQLAQALIELVIQQTTLKNKQQNNGLMPLAHKEGYGKDRRKDRLIQDLLLARIEDEAIAASRARKLGIDLNPPRAVILIDAANYILVNPGNANEQSAEQSFEQNMGNEAGEVEQGDPIEQQRAQAIVDHIVSFFHLPNETICTTLGQGRVCVLKASDSKNLDLWTGDDDIPRRSDSSWANLLALKRAAVALRSRLARETGSTIRIGIGRYHPGLEGLARSYEDARAALALGSRLRADDSVHCLAELGIAAFVGVADEVTKIELAKYLLGPLDQEPELLDTIDAFFAENRCASATAKQLYIHRNTLGYRLDKIASLTGLDPRKFDDAVQIRLSLLLRSLNRQPI